MNIKNLFRGIKIKNLFKGVKKISKSCFEEANAQKKEMPSCCSAMAQASSAAPEIKSETLLEKKEEEPSAPFFEQHGEQITLRFDSKSAWKGAAVIFIGLFTFTQVFGFNLDIVHRLKDSGSAAGYSSNSTDSSSDDMADHHPSGSSETQTVSSGLQEAVLPSNGINLPVKWNDLGKKMVDAGVIDKVAFEVLYKQRGGLGTEEKNLLYGSKNGALKMTSENSGFLLNLLWAFGLSNKNEILEKGPMEDSKYGGAENFASTGGWSLSNGDAMDHYSKHGFVKLSSSQQEKVVNVAKGIYRPCCGNSTYFPDCNHGMAMLGLLELLAANGASENQMYKTALQVNSFWFPQNYLTIAKYFEDQGTDWNKVDAKTVLGSSYSSSAGYNQVVSKTQPVQSSSSGGGGCGA